MVAVVCTGERQVPDGALAGCEEVPVEVPVEVLVEVEEES